MGLFGFLPSSRSKRTIKGLERDKFRGVGDHDWRTSDAMEHLLKDPRVRNVLNTRKEQEMFFQKLQQRGVDRRGVTADDVVEMLGEMHDNKLDRFDKREVNALGEALGLTRGEMLKMQRMMGGEAERPKVQPRSAEELLDESSEK